MLLGTTPMVKTQDLTLSPLDPISPLISQCQFAATCNPKATDHREMPAVAAGYYFVLGPSFPGSLQRCPRSWPLHLAHLPPQSRLPDRRRRQADLQKSLEKSAKRIRPDRRNAAGYSAYSCTG